MQIARYFIALSAVLCLLAGACGSSDEQTTSSGTTVTTSVSSTADTATQSDEDVPATTETPVAVQTEFDVEAFTTEITKVVAEWQTANGAPAVTLSVRLPGMKPINIAEGVVDITTDEPVSTEDYFRVGSITKPMTAAVVLQLVDEGLVELDVPVRTYLPGWLDGYLYADKITIRQLMDHTNGLKEYALDPDFYRFAGQRLETAIEPEETLEWLASQEPLFAPGTQYSYETGGFLTLGRVIETVTGNSAASEMRARIFEPSGAEHIFLTPEEFPPEGAVHGYGRQLMYLAGTAIIDRPDVLGLMINDDPVVDMLSVPQQLLQSAGWTGGGNEAQAESVARIFAAMFDGTILTEGQIDLMTTPTLDTDYGLGISSDVVDGVKVYSHGGGVPGFRSQAGYLPDYDVSYAVSASLIPLPEGAGVAELQGSLAPILVAAADELAG